MASDGFSLDDKRLPVAENDIPDILECWKNRNNPSFQAQRQARLEELKRQLTPLNQERLRLEEELNRLTFEQAISPTSDGPAEAALQGVKTRLEDLKGLLVPPRSEYNQLSRQFWVSKEQVKANKYDLSASRYRQMDSQDIYYEKPQVTLERMTILENEIEKNISDLQKLIE